MIGDVLRVLFYIAVLASLSVYGWRAYRNLVHHETRHDRTARRQGIVDPDGRPSTPEPGTTSSSAADNLSSRRGQTSATPSAPIEDGSLVREVIRQEMAKRQAADGQPLGAGASTDADAATDGSGRTGMFAKARKPVAELLTGISLPCDLSPLVDRDEIDPHRAVFATAGHAPATVARALADELERLGFRVDSVSDQTAVARKPDGDLQVTIHDNLAEFPTAPRSGVVVELTS